MTEMHRMPLEVAKAQIQVGGSRDAIAIYYLHKEEDIRREIEEIHAAMLRGDTSYQLKYTVNVTYKWYTLRIVE